jgi:nucleoside-diphosphate-sugar epimerase
LRRIGNGDNRIDTVFVENAAEAQLLAADALAANPEVSGRAYFISQDDPVNCWKWIDELLALAGLPPVSKSLSLSAAWGIGAGMEAAYKLLPTRSEPRMTRFLAAQLGVSHYFNISRAKTDLGYRPRVSTEEGMRRLAVSLGRET